MGNPYDQFLTADSGAGPNPYDQFDRPERRSVPRESSGPWEAAVAGYQGSATGLLVRGRLPDVVLNREHAHWYERAIEGIASTASEVPEMAAGAFIGGLPGTLARSPAATLAGTGAGMMAVPTEIRESLMRAYQNGEVDSSADFLTRAGIVIKGLGDKEVMKATGKSAVVGATTLLGGAAVARAVGSAIFPAIGESISVGTARAAIGTAQTAAEVGTMTVLPAALEGRLPEMRDIADAAIVVAGMKAAGHVSSKIADIYAKTGVTPEQVVADAKADPAITTDLKADGTDIPKAYKPLAEAEMLKAALPEPVKIAEVISNPTGTITEGKEPNHINYRYSETPQDIQSLRAKLSETFETEIEAQRGRESWDATQQKAEAIIKNRLSGMSDEQKATLSSMSFQKLAAQSMAVEAMAQRAAFDVKNIAAEIAAKGDAAGPEDHARLVTAIEQAALIHQIDQGNGAEIARALNSRKAAAQRGALAEGMTELLGRYAYDPRILAKMVLGLHTTAELTKFAKDASKATTWEKVVEAWKAGILSGPVTHIANIVGNTTFMALRPAIDLTASAIGILTGGERVSAVEPFSRVFGNLQGAKDALMEAGAALELAYGRGGFKEVAKQVAVGSGETVGKTDQFRKAIGGITGDIVRLPFRALTLADDFFKTMNNQGERYALASRQAVKEGFNLSTREFRDRVVDLVQNDEKIAKAGEMAAERFTFNSPLGAKGQAVQNLVKQANLQLLVPFIRTPGNIFKEMIRMTPLAPIIGEWRAAWDAGGTERAKAVSELAMGTVIGGVVASYVADGSISGQGSADPNKRRVQVASGWQPYSVKVGNTWYSYQRLQPLGTLMGMAADLMEVGENITEDEGNKAATMLAVAFANAVTQQTFLQGITSIVQVLADPQRYGPRFVEQYAASIVPAIIAQPTAMLDPIQREIGGIVDAVKARIPGLRGELEAKINPLTGQPTEAKGRLGEVSPITTTDESKDPVLSEAARLKIGIGATPKKIDLPAAGQKDIGKVELTPEQRTMFATTAGKITHDMMTQIVNSEAWDSWKPMQQKRAFEIAIERGREIGRLKALPMEQMLAEAQRIQAKVTERSRK